MNDSNDPKERTRATGAIPVSDFSVEVPGVTQLLNPQLANQRKNPSKKTESAEPSLSQAPHPGIDIALETPPAPLESTGFQKSRPSHPLSQFGIHYSLKFEETNGSLRFQGHVETGTRSFERWRVEFFKNMKIDLRILSITVSFQEFSGDRFPFQREAFGIGPKEFVQCVRDPKDRKILYVLISSNSMLGKKNEIEEALGAETKSEGGGSDGEFKIELAS